MKKLVYALTATSILGLHGCSQTVYYKHAALVDNPNERCVIDYHEDSRELHILGKKDSDNFAEVNFIDPSPPSLFPTKINVLCRWGVSDTQVVTAEFVTAWLTTAPADTNSQPSRIHEIFFHGSSAADTFVNNTSIPSIAYGKAGNDVLIGGRATDYLYGHENDDILYGRQGEDRLFGDVGNDDLFGGRGADDLLGGQGSDDLYGGRGGDYLHVELQPPNAMNINKLCGGRGADVLNATSDNEATLLDSERSDQDQANGINDGAVDTLIGGSSLEGWQYEYTQGGTTGDTIEINGETLEPGDDFPPVAVISCNDEFPLPVLLQ